MTLNAKSTKDVKGIAVLANYAGAANDKARVQLLIDLLEPEATMTHRGHLDQISPVAKIHLLNELQALWTAVS